MRIVEVFKRVLRGMKFWGKPRREKEGLKPWVFAYRVLGKRISRFTPRFKGLEKSLIQSRLRISFQAYLSLTLLSSTIVFFTSLIISALLLFQLPYPLILTIPLWLGTSLGMGLLTFGILCLYPRYVAGSLKRRLEANLPFAASYMAVLASAGVPPAKMFRSMAAADGMEGVSDEAQTVVRNIEILGQDTLTGIEKVSGETVSKPFSYLLDGFITTVRAGGNLPDYLTVQARQSIEDKRLSIRRFLDTLTILSEMYVTAVIVAPIVSAIILSMMAVLGGGLFIDPITLIYIITFIFIPLINIVFILLIESLSPKV